MYLFSLNKIRRLQSYVRSRIVLQYIIIITFFLSLFIILFFSSFQIMMNMLNEEVYKQFDRKMEIMNTGISKSFDEITAVSHSLATDNLIQDHLKGKYDSYISDKVIMERIQSLLLFSSLEPYLDLTFQDSEKRIFSNWSRNFNTYEHLFDSKPAIEAKTNDGYIVYEDFDLSFNKDKETEKTLNIYRGILDNSLIILTVSEKLFGSIFEPILSTDNGGIYLVAGDEITHTGLQNHFLSSRDLFSIIPIESLAERGNLKWDSRRFLYYKYKIKNIPRSLEENDWSLYLFLEYKNVSDQISLFTTLIIIGNLAAILLLVILFYLINKDIVKPITDLSLIMKSWQLNKKLRLPLNKNSNEIGQMFDTFSVMDNSIRDLFGNLDREHKIRELYQYKALRSRLNPHFLFNTLNTVKMLAVIDKNNPIISMIDSLGGILNYSMKEDGGWVTLKEEFSIIKNYVTIQNTRFSSSIKLINKTDDNLNPYIIKFILQPVIENIFVHGFDNSKMTDAKITISAIIEEDILIIEVEDNGKGIPADRLKELLNYTKDNKSNENERDSIGLPVINEMIKTLCGSEYGISFLSKENMGTKVIFTLPCLSTKPKSNNGDNS